MTPMTAKLDRLSRHLRELEKIEDMAYRPRSNLHAPHNSPESPIRARPAREQQGAGWGREQQGAGPVRPHASPAPRVASPAKVEQPSFWRRHSGKLAAAAGLAGLAAVSVASGGIVPGLMAVGSTIGSLGATVGTGVATLGTAVGSHVATLGNAIGSASGTMGNVITHGAKMVGSAITGPPPPPPPPPRPIWKFWGGARRQARNAKGAARTAKGAAHRRGTKAVRPAAHVAASALAVGRRRVSRVHRHKEGAGGVSGAAKKRTRRTRGTHVSG